jgi:hypothetical protein
MELAMQITAPRGSASSMPDAVTTSLTCASVATITMTTSACAPTSTADRHSVMPRLWARCIASGATS